MKKIWTTVIIGLVLMSMAAVVSASQYAEVEQNLVSKEISVEEDDLCEIIGDDTSRVVEQSKERERIRNEQTSDKKEKAKFKGIWGYADDNETQGYVGGYLGRRGRTGYLKGRWSTIDNSSGGFVVGILKKGYFNGRLINQDGGFYPITGFYKINKEKQVLNIRWMTLNKVGWAHCRIVLPELESDSSE